MILLSEKRIGSTDQELGMQTQLDSLNNMGWVPSGHTSSSFVCKAKKCQNDTSKKHFDLITCSLLFKKSTTHLLKADIFLTTAHQRWADEPPVGCIFFLLVKV